MTPHAVTRRSFLAASTAGSSSLCILTAANAAEEKPRRKIERIGIGSIGLRYQGTVIADKARQYGDVVALADVDKNVLEQARAAFGSTPRIFEDYRQLIERRDVDVITIGTPDHWHVKMAIDACRAGKDV